MMVRGVHRPGPHKFCDIRIATFRRHLFASSSSANPENFHSKALTMRRAPLVLVEHST
jgi:hypothetical protein